MMRTMRNRWWSLSVLIAILVAGLSLSAFAAEDPLPSWNEGPAKQAIIKFVQDTTDKASPNYVPPEERLATFDQDGTLWVEQPIYTQIVFALDRVVELAPKHPEWNKKQPFKAVIARDRAAMAKFSDKDLEKIMVATHTGMSTDEFGPIAKAWLEKAKDSRWKRPYTELIYQPMLEVMQYLRDNGYTTYIVTGGGQEFVRVYADKVYGIPREHIIGSAIKTKFTYAKDGKPILMRPPKLLLNDNFSGKPEDIYLFTGRSPQAAFGNSTGDREMLEYSHAGGGATLVMLVLHDDAEREYAYGPAQGLPASKVGTFTQALYDEATKNSWSVISMKKDWKVIFPFDMK